MVTSVPPWRATKSLRGWLRRLIPILALLMVAVIAIPASVWKAPVNDAVYIGFDPNLDFGTSGGSGVVRVAADSIDMTAPSRSMPTVN
jgi:hypothetical protein